MSHLKRDDRGTAPATPLAHVTRSRRPMVHAVLASAFCIVVSVIQGMPVGRFAEDLLPLKFGLAEWGLAAVAVAWRRGDFATDERTVLWVCLAICVITAVAVLFTPAVAR